MKRFVVVPLVIGALAALAADAATPVREVRVRRVAVSGSLPSDMTSPEGKSRWHLESVPLGPAAIVSVAGSDATWSLTSAPEGASGPAASREVFTGSDASRWLLPDHDRSQMKMGARVVLDVGEASGGLTDDLRIEIETVGIGWVHLPSGPREVVLERALVLRRKAGERGFTPEALIHRWVDPRAGIVAQISGPPSADGTTRTSVDAASVVQDVITGAATLKTYVDQEDLPPFEQLIYGWDEGTGTPVSSLVPDPGISNMCDLANLSSWDFSGTTSGADTASTSTPVTAAETCNATRCGYNLPGAVLGREDRDLTGTVRKDNQVTQREDRASDVTIWLRGGAQNEGKSGVFGSGESGFCFISDGSGTRTQVPLWRYSHNDAGGWYMQAGDAWGSGVMNCEPSFFTTVCGAPQPLTPNPLYAYACTNSGQTYSGTQSTKILKGGVVTLPSGHTLNALLVRNTAEYCINSASSCIALFFSARVRTILYYWNVPYLGSVVLLRGPQNVDYTSAEMSAGAETPCTNFTTLDFTDIGYGLFPPVSITAGAVTDTSVTISWDPGNDTHRISGYKIYWDTDSGSSTDYAFNSVANAGQVVFNGTQATISGLTPGTQYYFTVTSLSDFTDPSTSVVTQYESIRYPTTVSGDPSYSYPVEVTATTTGGSCIPTQEVTGLTVDKATPNIHVCWNASSDPCAVGYDVLASDDVTTDASWSVVGQTGLTTCWDGNPSQTYLLVRVRGTGGTGPWGHYGH